MVLSKLQKEIIEIFGGDFNKVITKKEIVELVGKTYFYNQSKYVGDRIGRLVKSGNLIRIRRGSFKLGNGKKIAKIVVIPNQSKLQL